MDNESSLSLVETKVLPKLLEGMKPPLIGNAVQLSDQNVRLAIYKLKERYNVQTLAQALEHARREFGNE